MVLLKHGSSWSCLGLSLLGLVVLTLLLALLSLTVVCRSLSRLGHDVDCCVRWCGGVCHPNLVPPRVTYQNHLGVSRHHNEYIVWYYPPQVPHPPYRSACSPRKGRYLCRSIARSFVEEGAPTPSSLGRRPMRESRSKRRRRRLPPPTSSDCNRRPPRSLSRPRATSIENDGDYCNYCHHHHHQWRQRGRRAPPYKTGAQHGGSARAAGDTPQ